MTRFLLQLILACSALALSGCASKYYVPGPKADLQSFAPANIQEGFASKPTNPFPAALALVRVQAPGYTNYNLERSGGAYGRGRYSVVLTREVETDAHLQRISRLPQMNGVVSLNRLLLPEQLDSDAPLREAAARLHADLLLLYTFDTRFYDRDLARPLSVVTLGLSPTQQITATTTASALLIDTRTGHIYSAYETTERDVTVATAWNTEDAADAIRRRNESRAFDKLVNEFADSWPTLIINALKTPPPLPRNASASRGESNTLAAR